MRSLGAAFLIAGISAGSFGAGAGTSGGGVLDIGVGARAIGMGEAYTAMADEVNSLYWNPAGIAIMNQSQASFLYNQWLGDLTFQNASFAVPFEYGGMGASLSHLSFGDIDGYDANGAPTGNVDAYSGVATLGAGLLGEWWALGANLKGVQGSLADEKATGFAADLGGTMVLPKEVLGGTVRLGATVRNMGTGLKFLQERDPFPLEYRFGASLVQTMNQKLNVSVDVGKVRDASLSVYSGLEYWVHRLIALRAGYAGTEDESDGIRAGVGFKLKNFSLDYAFSGFGDLGMTHRYEVSMRWGPVRPTLTPEQRRMFRQAKRAIQDERYSDSVLLMDALVKTQPSYKPFQNVMRVAMSKFEAQDKLTQAKLPETIEALTMGLSKPKQAASDGIEQKELEQLLMMGEPAYTRMNDSMGIKH